MNPKETGKNYDAMASWWLEQMKESTYGITALERALKFVENRHHALDVGCGCEGRFIRILQERGFQCTGLDVSEAMVALATIRYPNADFSVGDMCTWQLPRKYDLITAWDSTFHLPLESHEPVLLKLCDGLSKNGVLLFTCGEGRGTVQGAFGGKQFEYSSVGVPEFIRLLWRFGCTIQHVEYDQYPENHIYLIARKTE
ncbi:MAG: class I SAM-dependent methyltransferase [Nitrospira sp.]|nr:class I SAM-dependent methyltransferase [Nitrospira sp.]